MDTRRLEEGSRLFGATRWSAIATGVFVALALQTVLLLLGLALGRSVGDEAVGGGFALWAIIVQLCSIAVGAALAASTSHADTRMGGIAAGVMTWAVSLVLGGVLSGVAFMRGTDGGDAWSAFFGALLGLGAAILGGAFGATLGRTSPTSADRGEPLTSRPITTHGTPTHGTL